MSSGLLYQELDNRPDPKRARVERPRSVSPVTDDDMDMDDTVSLAPKDRAKYMIKPTSTLDMRKTMFRIAHEREYVIDYMATDGTATIYPQGETQQEDYEIVPDARDGQDESMGEEADGPLSKCVPETSVPVQLIDPDSKVIMEAINECSLPLWRDHFRRSVHLSRCFLQVKSVVADKMMIWNEHNPISGHRLKMVPGLFNQLRWVDYPVLPGTMCYMDSNGILTKANDLHHGGQLDMWMNSMGRTSLMFCGVRQMLEDLGYTLGIVTSMGKNSNMKVGGGAKINGKDAKVVDIVHDAAAAMGVKPAHLHFLDATRHVDAPPGYKGKKQNKGKGKGSDGRDQIRLKDKPGWKSEALFTDEQCAFHNLESPGVMLIDDKRQGLSVQWPSHACGIDHPRFDTQQYHKTPSVPVSELAFEWDIQNPRTARHLYDFMACITIASYILSYRQGKLKDWTEKHRGKSNQEIRNLFDHNPPNNHIEYKILPQPDPDVTKCYCLESVSRGRDARPAPKKKAARPPVPAPPGLPPPSQPNDPLSKCVSDGDKGEDEEARKAKEAEEHALKLNAALAARLSGSSAPSAARQDNDHKSSASARSTASSKSSRRKGIKDEPPDENCGIMIGDDKLYDYKGPSILSFDYTTETDPEGEEVKYDKDLNPTVDLEGLDSDPWEMIVLRVHDYLMMPPYKWEWRTACNLAQTFKKQFYECQTGVEMTQAIFVANCRLHPGCTFERFLAEDFGNPNKPIHASFNIKVVHKMDEQEYQEWFRFKSSGASSQVSKKMPWHSTTWINVKATLIFLMKDCASDDGCSRVKGAAVKMQGIPKANDGLAQRCMEVLMNPTRGRINMGSNKELRDMGVITRDPCIPEVAGTSEETKVSKLLFYHNHKAGKDEKGNYQHVSDSVGRQKLMTMFPFFRVADKFTRKPMGPDTPRDVVFTLDGKTPRFKTAQASVSEALKPEGPPKGTSDDPLSKCVSDEASRTQPAERSNPTITDVYTAARDAREIYVKQHEAAARGKFEVSEDAMAAEQAARNQARVVEADRIRVGRARMEKRKATFVEHNRPREMRSLAPMTPNRHNVVMGQSDPQASQRDTEFIFTEGDESDDEVSQQIERYQKVSNSDCTVLCTACENQIAPTHLKGSCPKQCRCCAGCCHTCIERVHARDPYPDRPRQILSIKSMIRALFKGKLGQLTKQKADKDQRWVIRQMAVVIADSQFKDKTASYQKYVRVPINSFSNTIQLFLEAWGFNVPTHVREQLKEWLPAVIAKHKRLMSLYQDYFDYHEHAKFEMTRELERMYDSQTPTLKDVREKRPNVYNTRAVVQAPIQWGSKNPHHIILVNDDDDTTFIVEHPNDSASPTTSEGDGWESTSEPDEPGEQSGVMSKDEWLRGGPNAGAAQLTPRGTQLTPRESAGHVALTKRSVGLTPAAGTFHSVPYPPNQVVVKQYTVEVTPHSSRHSAGVRAEINGDVIKWNVEDEVNGLFPHIGASGNSNGQKVPDFLTDRDHLATVAVAHRPYVPGQFQWTRYGLTPPLLIHNELVQMVAAGYQIRSQCIMELVGCFPEVWDDHMMEITHQAGGTWLYCNVCARQGSKAKNGIVKVNNLLAHLMGDDHVKHLYKDLHEQCQPTRHFEFTAETETGWFQDLAYYPILKRLWENKKLNPLLYTSEYKPSIEKMFENARINEIGARNLNRFFTTISILSRRAHNSDLLLELAARGIPLGSNIYQEATYGTRKIAGADKALQTLTNQMHSTTRHHVVDGWDGRQTQQAQADLATGWRRGINPLNLVTSAWNAFT